MEFKLQLALAFERVKSKLKLELHTQHSALSFLGFLFFLGFFLVFVGFGRRRCCR